MQEVVLVIHLMLALAVTILVLLQRSEGGGLGIGSSGGMGALATANTTANVLSRTTAICVAGFFTTSLILAILSGASHRTSLIDELGAAPVTTEAPATPSTTQNDVAPPTPAPRGPVTANPSTPVSPSVPVAK
jgi:preprotein translocase subunit SecG